MYAKKFEDLQAWQHARTLTRSVYQISIKGPLAKDFGLRDQLRRAAVSIMANIAEGFDCRSRVEFIRFLGYARRSAVEVQSLLYVCLDAAYISPDTFATIFEQARVTKALTGALLHSLLQKISHT